MFSPGGASGGRGLLWVDSCKDEDVPAKADEGTITPSVEEPLLHIGIHIPLIVRIVGFDELQLLGH